MKKKDANDIKKLAALAEADIDTSDIPETTDWSSAVVGKFYRPVKKTLTIRLDADVVDWFQTNNKHYQSAINKALREYVENAQG